ncbi:MAG: metallophosphoesterase [Candidatus Bathyarchaeia archaeon]
MNKDVIRIYFATDVHGSDKCWRKLVNVRNFYKVDAVILGGDLTGKAIVPIIRQPDGSYESSFMARHWRLQTEDQVKEHEEVISNSGLYPYRTTPEEVHELSINKIKMDELFKRLIIERMRKWLEIAEASLKDKGIKIIVTPGNDDDPMIDDLIRESEVILNSEGKVVEIAGKYEMISSGWSNPTPWRTPKECSEEELEKKIDDMVSKLKNVSHSIFNLHVPPYGSGLDSAPQLDENLKPVDAGQRLVPVGSTAVLNAVTKYQPLLGLHGHIHESKNAIKIGKTICLNPGSNYSEGMLMGVIVNIENGRVKNYIFTSG